MKKENSRFRHESLQDRESIKELLKAVTRGIGKGKVRFSDDNGEIVMEPEGLLNLKISASQEEGRHRISIRIRWQEEETDSGGGKLAVSD